jgi:hypothetical protein
MPPACLQLCSCAQAHGVTSGRTLPGPVVVRLDAHLHPRHIVSAATAVQSAINIVSAVADTRAARFDDGTSTDCDIADGETGAVYLGHLDPACLNFAPTPFAMIFRINLLFA